MRLSSERISEAFSDLPRSIAMRNFSLRISARCCSSAERVLGADSGTGNGLNSRGAGGSNGAFSTRKGTGSGGEGGSIGSGGDAGGDGSGMAACSSSSSSSRLSSACSDRRRISSSIRFRSSSVCFCRSSESICDFRTPERGWCQGNSGKYIQKGYECQSGCWGVAPIIVAQNGSGEWQRAREVNHQEQGMAHKEWGYGVPLALLNALSLHCTHL